MKKYILSLLVFMTLNAGAQEKINLVLQVLNAYSNESVSYAQVEMINFTTNQKLNKKTDIEGRITIDLYPNMSYKLIAQSESDSNLVIYSKKEVKFETQGIQPVTNIEYKVELKPTYQLGSLANFDDLQFEVYGYKLNENQQKILDLIYVLLKENPKVLLEVNGYAACILTEDDANTISVERAKSVVFYLTDKGVDHNRIKASAWGKEQRKSNCTCQPKSPQDIPCKDIDYEQDSRVSFKFTNL